MTFKEYIDCLDELNREIDMRKRVWRHEVIKGEYVFVKPSHNRFFKALLKVRETWILREAYIVTESAVQTRLEL